MEIKLNYGLLKNTINNCPIYENNNEYIIINKNLILDLIEYMEFTECFEKCSIAKDTNKENKK